MSISSIVCVWRDEAIEDGEQKSVQRLHVFVLVTALLEELLELLYSQL